MSGQSNQKTVSRAPVKSRGPSADQAKLFMLVAVTAACVLWLSYFVFTRIEFRSPPKAPDSPAWQWLRGFQAKLGEDSRFADATVIFETEEPMKLKLVGAVHQVGDKAILEQLVKAEKPDVEVINELELHTGPGR